ncbi:TPA: hypothetical protein TZS71_001527 [Streptococcus suis]|nr:hypothetical protein [Streptococcus suis]
MQWWILWIGERKRVLETGKDVLDSPTNQQYVQNLVKDFAIGFEDGLDIGRKQKNRRNF